MPTIERPSADVTKLILWCLRNLSSLADEFTEQLMLIEGYKKVGIDPQEFRETAHDAIEVILRKAAGMPLGSRLEGVSEAIGRRRAVQGVPLELLLQGVRMAFRVLWATMHDRATTVEREALGHSVVGIWEAIEFHTVRVHAGYLEEVARMRQHREAELTLLLSEFLDHDKPSGALTLQVGRTLGLLTDDSFLVAAVSLTEASDARQRLAHTNAQLHALHDSVLVLMPADTDPLALMPLLDGLRVAFAPVAGGLAAVPSAWAIAHDLLVAAPADSRRPMTLSEGWPNLIKVLLPELSETIGAHAVAGLSALSPETREQLVETVETYMRTGSLSRTSELLFCHRNTVLKRLSRFDALTGLDASIPWQAATIRLALAVVG